MANIRKRKCFKRNDPGLVEAFRLHCEAGWSPRSFSGQISRGHQNYGWLMKNNEKFASLARFFEKKFPKKGQSCISAYLIHLEELGIKKHGQS